MSTTQHHGTHTSKAAPAPATPAVDDPNADAYAELLDVLTDIEDTDLERQAIQAATQAVKQFVQQDTKAAPAGSSHHQLVDTELATKTARSASFWDGLFGQVAADHRAGAPPLSNQ